MLHEPAAEGGLGFCASELPSLLPEDYHGPLVVALDSSVLIDLQQHGNAIMVDRVAIDDPKYNEELDALGKLLDLWLLRDIRFILTPRSYTDARKLTERFVNSRGPAIGAVARSLAFQSGDWEGQAPSEWGELPARGEVLGLPMNADRDLVLEAQAVAAHVFLTRDEGLLATVEVRGERLVLCRPTQLISELDAAGVTHFVGGVCGGADCPYPRFPVPGPDLGKWTGLLSIFE